MRLEWVNYAVKDSETLDVSLGMQTASASDLKEKYRDIQTPGQFEASPEQVIDSSKVGKLNAGVGGSKSMGSSVAVELNVPSLTEKQMKLQKALQIAQDIEDYRYVNTYHYLMCKRRHVCFIERIATLR